MISDDTEFRLFDTDRFGWTTLEIDQLGNTFELWRNEHGQVTKEIRPLENGQTMEAILDYDDHGRRLFDGRTGEAWTYDGSSHSHKPLTYTRGGETWTFTYDANHNLQTSADPLGNVTAYTYTPRGLVETITGADPDGPGGTGVSPVTTFQYDTMGRLTQITYADQTTETFVWDSADNLTSETDRLGRTTTYTWDAYQPVEEASNGM